MHYQRLTVVTITRESAERIFSTFTRAGWSDTEYRMPSFTDSEDIFTVAHDIPCVPGNMPLEDCHRIIGRYLGEIISYTSNPSNRE